MQTSAQLHTRNTENLNTPNSHQTITVPVSVLWCEQYHVSRHVVGTGRTGHSSTASHSYKVSTPQHTIVITLPQPSGGHGESWRIAAMLSYEPGFRLLQSCVIKFSSKNGDDGPGLN
jgi:hypothetical protein